MDRSKKSIPTNSGAMRFTLFRPTEAQSPNRKIFRAGLIVGFLTLVVKVGNAGKELVIAQWFGRTDALDAFLIAFLLPMFVLTVVVGGFGSALIPTFMTTRQNKGMEAAHRLFASAMLVCLILLTFIAILLALLASYDLPYLGSSFSQTKLHLTRELLYVLLPFILFGGLSACAASVLNAGERFAIPALAPLLTPLVTVLLVYIGARRWGAFTLAEGVLAGSILEASVVIYTLQAHGMRFSLAWYGFTPELRAVLGQYIPMLAASFLAGGASIIDQSMAAMLQPGSVAALSYANKIVSAVAALGVAALGTSVLPYFSKMVASGDWNGCRHTLKRYSLLVIATTIPIALGLIVFAKPLVKLLFQRGAFSTADTQLVSWVEVCYASQIPFCVWLILFVRFLSAVGQNRLLMYASAISLALDVLLNLVLMRVMGIAGIALSTSLVYLVSFLVLSCWSMRILVLRQAQSRVPPAREAEVMR